MATAIRLIGNDYSNASAAFWIANLIAGLPNIWILNRFPVARWLAICLVGWGIATACHAALTNYHGLLAVRIISGAFEAGIPPAAQQPILHSNRASPSIRLLVQRSRLRTNNRRPRLLRLPIRLSSRRLVRLAANVPRPRPRHNPARRILRSPCSSTSRSTRRGSRTNIFTPGSSSRVSWTSRPGPSSSSSS